MLKSFCSRHIKSQIVSMDLENVYFTLEIPSKLNATSFLLMRGEYHVLSGVDIDVGVAETIDDYFFLSSLTSGRTGFLKYDQNFSVEYLQQTFLVDNYFAKELKIILDDMPKLSWKDSKIVK